MPQTTHRLAAMALVVAALTGSASAQEPRMVPVTVDGEHVRLEMRVGSTGRGTDPAIFTRPLDFPEVARFVEHRWAVVIPARRGRQSIFIRGARYPGDTIWRYGDDDPFYPLSHSRPSFAAFQAAGGREAFHELPPEFDGHYIWRRPDRWGPLVEDYLKSLGLSR